MKAYLEISVDKELPKEYDKYHCFLHSGAKVTAYYKKDWIIPFDEVITKSVKSYLREFSLPELMERYAFRCHCNENMNLSAEDFLKEIGIL